MTAGDYDIPSYMVKPPTLGRWEAVRLGIWNPETKQFLGRTAKSWGGIFIFYTIFYAALAALFAICIKGLYWSLDDHSPTWQLDRSLIGNNPGMGFRPMSDDVEKTGSLVWYVANDTKNVKEWTDRLDNFLKPYKQTGGQNTMVCDFDKPPTGGKVCDMDINKWEDCSPANNYGYDSSKPCFFIKLNKIYGWKPETYQDPADLPEEMPQDLKDHIGNTSADARNVIWISCGGENPADRENIGKIQYYPESMGFPAYYYPFTNQKNFLSPLMAIRLLNPKMNVLINVECRAWAKNIAFSRARNEREGSLHLEVLID